jgi:hypothetical protein
MTKIITIPNDNDSVMNGERNRIIPWVVTHSWRYAGYNDQMDHILQIRGVAAGESIEVIDCDCHGNPVIFDHTPINSANAWGKELSRSTGFSGNTAIYLDACNTGLRSAYGGPIAQEVANGAGCTVYGTKGYMTGTFAEGNERCYASPNGLPPYPGGQDATGRNVWISFHPITIKSIDKMMQLTINIPPASLKSQGITNAIEEIINGNQVEFPQLRMAPDITLNYVRKNEVMILDVYANGGIIKERTSGTTWKVSHPEQFQALIKEHLD